MSGPAGIIADAMARMLRAQLAAGRLTPAEARALLESERVMLPASRRQALVNAALDRIAAELRLPPAEE